MAAEERTAVPSPDTSHTTGELERVLAELREANERLVTLGVELQELSEQAETRRAQAEGARAEAEALSHAKDEFLAVLSHELRTPLNAILGWTAMMKAGILDSRRTQHALATIERNARAQARLIEDLLDLSRAITGKLHLELGPVDIVETADAAADAVRLSAAAKRIHLDVVAEQRPVLVLADAHRLQQAIWNLVANAVKFTPTEGRVQLRLSADDSSATIVVSDTGKGIDSGFLPHVFDRFRQEDSSTTRAHDGLGVGLAIVKSVVEAHGGTVNASSAGVGCGSTFTIALPVVAPVERRREQRRPPQTIADVLRDVRVLVVDDTADERDLLAQILGRSGAVVAVADSVASAVSELERFRPAVIVSDVAMPEQDGYELLRRVRAHRDPSIANTPAVAVTARAQDRRRALSAGFQRYISKPVDLAQLVETVAAVLVRLR